jgi:hypothetical protein
MGQQKFTSDPKHRLEAILERAVTAYHRDERHGGAQSVGDRVLDAVLMPIARQAFLDADDLPADDVVLQALAEPMRLLGEGYHVIALLEHQRRFVVKYAKHPEPVPPLAPVPADSRPAWAHEHGVRPDGSLHPAIWQHIRAFEAYGPLGVPSRVYIADSVAHALSTDHRRALDRFRSIGIVRPLGNTPRLIRVDYPDRFPREKRAEEGLTAGVIVVQPPVIPLSAVIEHFLRSGDVAAAREMERRYREFTEQLWRCGISHLDFSLLNIGVTNLGSAARLQIFDPHIGEIDLGDAPRGVRDPLSAGASEDRSVDNVLRSSRDGSRWALWRVHEKVSASADVPPEGTAAAEALVRDFHTASEGLEEGHGLFGFDRFGQTWQQRPIHVVNTVLHAQLWTLVVHPLGELIRSVLDPTAADMVYERSIAVLGIHDDSPLTQFRAGLRVYEDRPLIVVANVADDPSTAVRHWGRLLLPAELDVQDDPAIHYHLRDLFTGETYVRPGDDLVRRGLTVSLAPHQLHLLRVEDVIVEDMAVERFLATHRDISEFLGHCTKRVGVVGDVHGELQALEEILGALGLIDALGHWAARDGMLVLTGDVGHGRHLQEVFEFIHRLAAEAHLAGGRIVWTLGNHDLYVDREGGQGGEDSLGYRLWPRIREAALHPEGHPGLAVQAAYFGHGKLFVHGGVLPNIVELASRELGSGDPETVASYINDALRETLLNKERISARDLPHEIFHIGTSHTRERRMPGEIGYEPAGVFTPDLREVDHYRFHAHLIPQIVGHTASRRGEIRYSPGSWLARSYIAIDVGRQHGTGNGGLLLTDFGWVAVTPGGPARLVEVTPLFARLARDAAAESGRREHSEAGLTEMLSAYFKVVGSKPTTRGDVHERLFAGLAPPQVVTLERFLTGIRQTGECVVVTDLDEVLRAFSRGAIQQDTIAVLAEYLVAGGVLVFTSDIAFDWFFARLLRPIVVELGPRSRLLANVLLVLSGGAQIYAFEDGAYRQISCGDCRDKAGALDRLFELSREQSVAGMPRLEAERTAYIADSNAPGGIDRAIAGKLGAVIDVGDAVLEPAPKPIVTLHRGYRRTIDTIVAAMAALREGARTPDSTQPDAEDTALWTFERPHFPPGRRLRVRVRGSGYVHAGVRNPDGTWAPVYNVPLVPVPEGGHEAVLPPRVNVFTFFWTEAPWTPGHPGHWEQKRRGRAVFEAARE